MSFHVMNFSTKKKHSKHWSVFQTSKDQNNYLRLPRLIHMTCIKRYQVLSVTIIYDKISHIYINALLYYDVTHFKRE